MKMDWPKFDQPRGTGCGFSPPLGEGGVPSAEGEVGGLYFSSLFKLLIFSFTFVFSITFCISYILELSCQVCSFFSFFHVVFFFRERDLVGFGRLLKSFKSPIDFLIFLCFSFFHFIFVFLFFDVFNVLDVFHTFFSFFSFLCFSSFFVFHVRKKNKN